VSCHGPSNGYSLLLSSWQVRSHDSYVLIESLLSLLYKCQGFSLGSSLSYLLLTQNRVITDIFSNGPTKQTWLLTDTRKMTAQIVYIIVSYIHVVDQNSSLELIESL
jgi:hypothetical protein